MKMYFKTRQAQRNFNGNGIKRDMGKQSANGKRWVVEIPLAKRK